MKQISAEDFEFLVFVQEELDRLEERAFGWPDEPTMREVSTRLRHLTHSQEGTLARLYSIFNGDLVLPQENAMFLYTLYDESSPAAYAVNFSSELCQIELDRFFQTHHRPGTYVIACPVIGFDRAQAKMKAIGMSLADYGNAPIIGIDRVLISRAQLISYLSNKKGLPHHSNARDKEWQRKLDKMWKHRTYIGATPEQQAIRGMYEVAQRIAHEVLSVPGLSAIRDSISELARQHKNAF
jgi:hypothetical protein